MNMFSNKLFFFYFGLNMKMLRSTRANFSIVMQ